jgi:predicted DNA-binding transcriptional regulator YafY
MPRGNQVVRLWRLLQLVSRPGGLTVAAAARELGCSIRTVWRDLNALQDAGFPIYDEHENGGREGVWRVQAGFQSRLSFPITLDEIVALVLSERLLAPAHVFPLGPAVTSFIGKVRALLAPSALGRLDDMADRVGVRALGAKLQGAAVEYLPAIQRALAERHALRVRYFSMSRAAETERRIDPYHLTYFNGGFYLIGYCHVRRAVRIFAVERIRAIAPLGETFTPPSDFDAGAYLASAWGLVRGERVRVRARFTVAVAPYIRERIWHPTQTIRELGDGRIELALDVADTVEVRRWLLGFGGDVEVLEPASLREAIVREAERVLAAGQREGPARVADGRRRPLARVLAARTSTPNRRPTRGKRTRAARRS